LANVAKHAAATRAAITARVDEGWLRLEVLDDGRGGASAESGTGLRGLTDRVEAMGGSLLISSPPANGTSIVARLPIVPT
jgi:signal transduction histidine kinase